MERRAAVGEGLLHPVVIAALGALLVNDHFLKDSSAPSLLTGKLSDVAGLILLPAVFTAASEWARFLTASGCQRGRVAGPISVFIAATVFALLQTSTLVTGLYERTLGFMQWVSSAAWSLATAEPVPPMVSVSNVTDFGDLLVLPACLIPLLLERH